MSTPGRDRPPVGPVSRGGRLLYRLFRAVGVLVCRLLWRMQVEGRDRLPTGVPYVVAPVHRSYVDFVVIGVAVPRLCRYMVKGTVWRSALAGRLAEFVGSFPVDRDRADRTSLRIALQALEQGDPLVMFPEGRRKEGPFVEELFDGPVWVASRARCPIVPVALIGTEEAMPIDRPRPRPARVRVVFGEPIYPDVPVDGRIARASITTGTAELQRSLQELYDLRLR